jgi:DNA polymerase-1
MIALYLAGEDIHLNTAAAISGIPLAKFKLGLKCEIPLMDVANDWKGASAYLLTLRSEDRKVWHDPKTGELKGATVKSYLKSLRQRAKAVNFGFLYGMGARKFRAYAKTDYGVTVSLEEAEAMREMFFTLYPDLLKWHEEMREYVNQFAYIRSLHGALRHLQDIYSVDEGIRRATERQAINSGVQRFASDWALMGAIRFHRDLKIKHQQEGGKKEAFISAFVHDAVIGQVRKDTELIERYASYMKWYMESVPITEWFGITPPLPITADVSLCSDSLGEVKELHHVIAQKPDWFTGD